MSAETTPNATLASQILVLLGHDPDHTPPELTVEAFRRCTRDQLLDFARRLGLAGVSKLSKDLLVARVQAAFQSLSPPPGNGTAPASGAASNGGETNAVVANGGPANAHGNGGEGGEPAGTGTAITFHKFDLGPTTEDKAIPQNIPWGYDQDRVTAMVVNPERLYAYWEVTDSAMEVARRALGPAGGNAWLNLRVYDITGRLFDGTNAHSYFDHQIERHDRQWFFEIGKPASTACVEIGLKSPEGYFVKIARSGRIEFPRRGPSGDAPIEWLTVRSASGHAGDPFMGSGAGAGPTPGGPPPAGGALGGEAQVGWAGWTEGAGFPEPGGQRVLDRRWEWQEGGMENWQGELSRVEWEGPLERAEWESGPFTYAVEPPPLVEQRDTGELTVRTQGGRVHLVYGPWRVVIRGIGARAERRILGTWEYKRTVAVTSGVERTAATWGRLHPGSSEWMALGASERVWLGASELLFRGSSELYLLGASELRLLGASETLYMGASELRMRGASERLLRGASEWMYRGASERRLGGASELTYAGASERLGAGASEHRLGGASEAFPPAPVPDPLPYPETT